MKKHQYVKKPFATLIVVIIIAIAIFYLKSQKSNLNSPTLNQTPIKDDGALKLNKGNDQTAILTPQIDKEKESKYKRAPDFAGIEKWINSEPLKIEQLKGKVVLVDFWTYTCINCIRTLPYLKEWDKKYKDKGLLIIGVHTPEFEFEKKYENVLKAVKDYQLKYPVAQDNNYATWSVYQNRYWPHKYLVDIDGYIRYDHIGEGNYEDTEKMIQSLLNERMVRLNQKNMTASFGLPNKPKDAVDVNAFNVRTPEIYFGYQFSRGNFGNQEGIKPEQVVDYKLPPSISSNDVYFSGKWKNNADNIELAGDEGEILLIFHAKAVNIVAGSENNSEASVFLDNELLNEKNKGSDVIKRGNQSIAGINEFKLYALASAENYDDHAIDIKIKGKGFKIYTFTFG